VTYEVEDSEVVYSGFSTVRADRVRMPDGDLATREVVEHTDAVAVVPLADDGTVVLLRQYRHPVGEAVLEIPAGKLDVDGEAPVDAARRELLEETGLTADSLELLVTFANSSGWTDEQTTVYLARGLQEGEVPADFTATAEEADMDIVRLPLEEALDAAQRGELTDAKTLIGLLLTAARS
jgi:ADP-ribose pyrophosphatase